MLFPFLRRFAAPGSKRLGRQTSRQHPPSHRLWLDVLEDRSLPSLFGPPTPYAVGFRPSSEAVGDFNRDGIPDLAVTNGTSNSVSVLLGNGDGTFKPAVNNAVGQSPDYVAVGDFNGDGNPDLAVAIWYTEKVSILPGDGKGGFGAATDYTLGDPPTSLAVGDFNGDGAPDLVAGTNGASNVSVLLNTGSGTFSPAQSYSVGLAFTPSVAVFSGRYGQLYLAVASPDIPTSNVTVMRNSFGSFTPLAHYTTGENSWFVTVADFNRDGTPDLAVSNDSSSSVSVLLGDGQGGFGPATDYATGVHPIPMAVGDFNGDGNPDLAVGTAKGVSVLLGDGKGGFEPAMNYALGSFPVSVAVGDFNGDGAPDLAAVDQSSGTVDVLLNQSHATNVAISTSQNPAVAGQLVTLTAAVSAAVPQSAQPTGLVAFQDGTNVLGTAVLDASGLAVLTTMPLGTGYHALTAVYQGDPHFTLSTSPVLNQLVKQAATTTTLGASVNPDTAGQPLTLTATVSPAAPSAGTPTGTVVFWDGGTDLGTGTLSGGAATLTTAALTPGSHSLSAAYLGDGNFTASTTVADLAETTNNPPPLVTSLSPAAVPEGSAGCTLTLNGTGFLPTSVVTWNGSTKLTVTDAGATLLQVAVPAGLVTDEGMAQVLVTNPGPGGGASLPVTVVVLDAPLSASGVNLSVTGHKNFSGVVATFTDANPIATAADFQAIITWDDGTAQFGTIGVAAGAFTVSGIHKFGGFNNVHAVTVTVYDKGGSQATVTDNIIDPPDLQGSPLPTSGPGLQEPQPSSSTGPVTAADPGSGTLVGHRRQRRHRGRHHARAAHGHQGVAPRPGYGHERQ
jgi:hypothetical protein